MCNVKDSKNYLKMHGKKFATLDKKLIVRKDENETETEKHE